MSRRFVPLAAVVATMVVAFIACGSGEESTQTTTAPPTPASAPVEDDVIEVMNKDVGGSGKYEFDPSELSFKVGQTVKFSLKAETEFHTFTVDDLEIDVALEAGKSELFTFTFDKAGSFELVCLSHPQMKGTITVQ